MLKICNHCGIQFKTYASPRKFCSVACAKHRTPIELRFWPKVDKASSLSGCWLWTGAQNNKGYGQIMVEGRPHVKHKLAHRLCYELLKGQIPTGMVLDHICRTPLCVNPDHLEPVTQRTNIHRGLGPMGINHRKTHCPNGHPLSGHNCMISHSGNKIMRECRTCKNARQNLAYHVRKGHVTK